MRANIRDAATRYNFMARLADGASFLKERPHFYKSCDRGKGEIEEAKPAKLSRFQSTAQAVFWLDEKGPSVCILRAADVQAAHGVLQSGTLQSQTLGSASIAGDLTRGSFQRIDDHVALCLHERRR